MDVFLLFFILLDGGREVSDCFGFGDFCRLGGPFFLELEEVDCDILSGWFVPEKNLRLM